MANEGALKASAEIFNMVAALHELEPDYLRTFAKIIDRCMATAPAKEGQRCTCFIMADCRNRECPEHGDPAPSPGVPSEQEKCPTCKSSVRSKLNPVCYNGDRPYDPWHDSLPARPELDKDEGGRGEPVGRCDVTIFGHTPAPHVEGKYCINWKSCDYSSSASGREKGDWDDIPSQVMLLRFARSPSPWIH